jgi:Reverse transcriptase (RNA-dependent DNA polymerase)
MSLSSNYRPISNLNTISKVLERLFLNRVQLSIVSSPNFNQFQNAYQPPQSTERCLLATLQNIFSSSDSGNSTLLVSLDLSAAFDSTDHAILLSRLKTSFGFDGLFYNWIESYLTGRSQTVTIGNNSSASAHVASGVPHGSVLGPLLFSIYTSPISSIAPTFSVSLHQSADDSQFYISLSPSNFPSQINRLEERLTALHAWCCQNSLSLNPGKSDSVLFRTRQRSHSFSAVTTVNVAGSAVPMADYVKLLSVTLDNHLSLDKHVNEVSHACFYHLRALRHIRPAITASDANMIAYSVVASRLDYANAVLYGVSSKNINRLQRIQDALARCVVDSKVHPSSNALLQQLDWLPIHQRINFKLAKLAFLARSSATSSYLNSSVTRYLPSRMHRSQDTWLLTVPRTETVIGSRAFRDAAPTVFNSLPRDIRSTDNISTFCRLLKTFYLRNAFDQY